MYQYDVTWLCDSEADLDFWRCRRVKEPINDGFRQLSETFHVLQLHIFSFSSVGQHVLAHHLTPDSHRKQTRTVFYRLLRTLLWIKQATFI